MSPKRIVENVRRFGLYQLKRSALRLRGRPFVLTDSTTRGSTCVHLESPILCHSRPLRTNAVLQRANMGQSRRLIFTAPPLTNARC